MQGFRFRYSVKLYETIFNEKLQWHIFSDTLLMLNTFINT